MTSLYQFVSCCCDKKSSTKSDLWNKEFILAYGSRPRIHSGDGSMAGCGQGQEAADYISYSKQEAKKATCKWCEALNS